MVETVVDDSRRTILQMIDKWIGNPDQRAEIVWPPLTRQSGLDPMVETYAITEELYNRIFPNGDDDAPTIPLNELHGSLYRFPPAQQLWFAELSRAAPREYTSGEETIEALGYYWTLPISEMSEEQQREMNLRHGMWTEKHGLKYNADYKEEMNRLYNRGRNGEPLNLTPEQRKQNPSEYDQALTQRIINEARRLKYWQIYRVDTKVFPVQMKSAHKVRHNNNSNAEGIEEERPIEEKKLQKIK